MAGKISALLVGLGVFMMMMAGGLYVRLSSDDSPSSAATRSAAPSTRASRSATPPRTLPATPSSTPLPTATPTPRPTTTTRPATTTTSAPPASWRLVWSDEFSGGSLDTAKWTARNDTFVDYDRACITNRPENVAVESGLLVLKAQREEYTCGSQTRSFTGAYLETIGKASFTYGAFEIRAQSPGTPDSSTGLWPAFWMRPDDGGNGEIDVVELPGGASYYRAATQAIFYDYTPVKQDHRHTFGSGYPADGFHVYRTEWEPGLMRWLIDGVEVFRRDRTTTTWFDEVFAKPYHLRLNFQVGGWLGDPDATTTFPADFRVDYVRVYQR